MGSSSSPALTKYEMARLVSARIGELEANACPTVPVTPADSLFDIASREVILQTLDVQLKRMWPNARSETLHLSTLTPKDA